YANMQMHGNGSFSVWPPSGCRRLAAMTNWLLCHCIQLCNSARNLITIYCLRFIRLLPQLLLLVGPWSVPVSLSLCSSDTYILSGTLIYLHPKDSSNETI